MKHLMTLCFLLAMTLPLAAVEDGQAMYVGGTVPAVKAGAIGRFDTTSETTITFESAGNKLEIPYAGIQSCQFSTEVTHHLGVLPAIAVGLLKARERRHFFRISYREGTAAQSAVFEVPKHMTPTLQAILQARTPQICKPPSSCAGQLKSPIDTRGR